jgi:hypothetical protein
VHDALLEERHDGETGAERERAGLEKKIASVRSVFGSALPVAATTFAKPSGSTPGAAPRRIQAGRA